MEGGIYQLEMPLPQAYIFTVEDKEALQEIMRNDETYDFHIVGYDNEQDKMDYNQ